jgi:hypothetical protein
MRLRNITRFVNRLTGIMHFGIAFALIAKPSFSSIFVADTTNGFLSPAGLASLILLAGIRWMIWPMRSRAITFASAPILILVSANTAYLITMRGQPLWPPIIYYAYGIVLLTLNWYYFLEAPNIATTTSSGT